MRNVKQMIVLATKLIPEDAERIKKVLNDYEMMTDFLRMAIFKEIERREATVKKPSGTPKKAAPLPSEAYLSDEETKKLGFLKDVPVFLKGGHAATNGELGEEDEAND